MLQIKTIRRELIKEVKKKVKPHLYKGGYDCLIATFKPDKDGGITYKKVGRMISLRDFSGDATNEIMGFTDYGVIVDSHMAIVIQDYSSICVEDLEKINKKIDSWKYEFR